MDADEVLSEFRAVGALLADDHFVLTSGRHSSAYLNKDAIYPYTRKMRKMCSVIADLFRNELFGVVVGPANGGIILAQLVADCLSSDSWSPQILAVYAEKTADGNFVFNRGYAESVVGRRVLIVEDILTTGGSVEKVVKLIREVGGEVIGVGALCNRGGVMAHQLGVPAVKCLASLVLPSYSKEECPLCRDAVPINVEVGMGREFLLAQAARSPV